MNNEALAKLNTRGISVRKSSRIPSYSNYRGSDSNIPSVKDTTNSTYLPKSKVYTGNNIVGIATMHKSNAVPVFSKEEAEDISKMRR